MNRRIYSLWHLCPRGGGLGPRFEADYASFVGRQEASRNGSRLSAGRVSAAAVTVLSVHLYHRRSLDIVLTSDKGSGGGGRHANQDFDNCRDCFEWPSGTWTSAVSRYPPYRFTPLSLLRDASRRDVALLFSHGKMERF